MKRKNKSFLFTIISISLVFLFSNPMIDGMIVVRDNVTFKDSSNEKTELFVSNYNQTVLVDEKGFSDINLHISIPQSKYLNLYKKMIGIYKENPDEFLMSTNKENYFNSINMEEYYSLGIISDFKNLNLNDFGKEGLTLNLNGDCDLKFEYLDEDNYNYRFGILSTDDSNDAKEYLLSVIAYTKKMLNSIEDNQVFKRFWTTEILFPDSLSIKNRDNLLNKKWQIDFGGGTFLKANITFKNQNTLVISEQMVVTEEEKIEKVTFDSYKSFEVEISDYNFDENKKNREIKTSSIVGLWDDEINFNKTLSKEYVTDYYTIGYDLSIDVDFIVHMDIDESWVKSDFHLDIDPYAIFHTNYNYDSEWKEMIPTLKWTFTIPIGPVIVLLSVELGPEIRLEFESDVQVSVNTSAWANGFVKAGARYESFKGFDNIWESDFQSGYEKPTLSGEGYVKVKPSVSFPITAKIYEGIIGITVRPVLYLDVIVKYCEEFYWYVKLGFKLNVKSCIGIPYFYEKCWDWEVLDYKIADWGNPSDQDPPNTDILISPSILKDNKLWVGRSMSYYFSSNDKGLVPSGVKETFYNFDNNDNWLNFEYSDLTWTIDMYSTSDYYSFDLEYYSIDKLGSIEEVNHKKIYADFVPPTSHMEIDGDYIEKDGKYKITEDTKIVLKAEDEKMGYRIWYRINTEENEGDWFLGRNNSAIILDEKLPENGEFEIEWRAEDELWNYGKLHKTEFIINHKPEKPSKPSGNINGRSGKKYTYQSSSEDIDGDLLYYQWSWGNENQEDWSGPYESGETVDASHTWGKEGLYYVMVRARDENGFISPWSDPLPITMPKTKSISIGTYLSKIISVFNSFRNINI